MHVHSCLSLVEIPDLHVNPPCLQNSNCKYTPMPSDFLFKGCPTPPLSLRFQKAVCGMVQILSGIAQFIYYIGQQDAAYWDRILFYKQTHCTQRRAQEPGLEIISSESLDTLTGQIHFSLVTFRSWPGQIYKIYNS